MHFLNIVKKGILFLKNFNFVRNFIFFTPKITNLLKKTKKSAPADFSVLSIKILRRAAAFLKITIGQSVMLRLGGVSLRREKPFSPLFSTAARWQASI